MEKQCEECIKTDDLYEIEGEHWYLCREHLEEALGNKSVLECIECNKYFSQNEGRYTTKDDEHVCDLCFVEKGYKKCFHCGQVGNDFIRYICDGEERYFCESHDEQYNGNDFMLYGDEGPDDY